MMNDLFNNDNNDKVSRRLKNESNYNKTRLIIKNIPKYMNELDLKKHFFKMKGKYDFKITDIKIMKRKKIVNNKEQYESRKICFIGFINNIDCENFKKSFDNTYINTSKITIEEAFSPIISKHVEKNKTNALEKKEINRNKPKKSVEIIKNEKFINKMIPIKKTKAGMNSTRSHVIYLDDETNVNKNEESNNPKKKKKKKKKKKNVTEKIENIEKDNKNNIESNTENNKENVEENALDWLKKISKNNGNDNNLEKKQNLFEEEIIKGDNNQSNNLSENKNADVTLNFENSDYENMNTGKLIIFNLPPVNEHDIKELCEKYGPVVDVKVFKNTKKGSLEINVNETNKSNKDFFLKLLKNNDDSLKEKEKKKKKSNNSNNNYNDLKKKNDLDEYENDDKDINTLDKKNIIIDNDLTNIKVYAFVNFMFPSACEKAKENLNNTIYRGKILYVKYAKEKLGDFEIYEKNKNNIFIKLSNDSKSSYKKILEIQKKRNCQNENIWNTLFTDINSNIHNFCKENKCSRESILNIKDKNIAVNVSLTETYIINKMKEWIKKEGIYLEAFEQIYKKNEEKEETKINQLKEKKENNELTEKEECQDDNLNITEKVIKYKRSNDTIIIKNLSMNTNQNDIINLFKKFGTLIKVSFSPYNNIAIIQFENSENAKKAFISNSYIRYKKLPLYLEWAPINLYEQKIKEDDTNKNNTNDNDILLENDTKKKDGDILNNSNEANKSEDELLGSESSDEEVTHASIYIKNINFNTKEEDLKKLFENLEGFLTCNIVKSKKVISQKEYEKNNTIEHKYISLGYGFAEFKSKECAIEAIKKLTGTSLDDHILELSLSHNRIKKKIKKNNEEKKVIKEQKKISKKLIVKNLAFQVTKEELRKLFSTFGNVKSVRIPKNAYNRSRGYAFIEFMSKNECLNAIESLQHTHLYGRHLIIDFANDFIFEQNIDEFDRLKENDNKDNKNSITSEQAKRKAIYESKKSNEISESKKRKVLGNLENI
ncbi:snoRNA-associated small subunit rRNA processing protein, putative [Plasmodium relictum]|uniref:SnoRNA-associated small subunit rRNA processing protein, putative n=1 Tax=Plasmodium relictum TaxID=85471 RepID=A0A1J1HCB5_PLARL|nr:snoRNA-associated small subunit rRNA processing protein, putative [Plasmodium relictum]CRH02600.1 snoRNA-associated small subunit rRNA processing protein, putative [Plasmodium relictum]